jgi:hypothetical protein
MSTQAQRLLLLSTPAPRQRVRINDPGEKEPPKGKPKGWNERGAAFGLKPLPSLSSKRQWINRQNLILRLEETVSAEEFLAELKRTRPAVYESFRKWERQLGGPVHRPARERLVRFEHWARIHPEELAGEKPTETKPKDQPKGTKPKPRQRVRIAP